MSLLQYYTDWPPDLYKEKDIQEYYGFKTQDDASNLAAQAMSLMEKKTKEYENYAC
jgi:hypothetical protein